MALRVAVTMSLARVRDLGIVMSMISSMSRVGAAVWVSLLRVASTVDLVGVGRVS